MTLDLNWHSANLWEPPPPPETETKPINSVASRTPRWARHCSATWHFTVANITQSDAFNYMSYHFLCKRGIRPARTEQFLVLFTFVTSRSNYLKVKKVHSLLMLRVVHDDIVSPYIIVPDIFDFFFIMLWAFLYHCPNTTWRPPWCLLCDVI